MNRLRNILSKYLEQILLFFLFRAPLKFIASRILTDDQIFKLVSKIQQTLVFNVKIHKEKFTIASSKADDHFPWLVFGKFKLWEKSPTQNFVSLIRNDSVVIDVGAYLGVYTLLACKAGAARVISVEPNSALLPWLNTNICLNGMQNLVTIENSGMSNISGSENLLTPVHRVSSSGAHLADSSVSVDLSQWKISEKIFLTTIDSLVDKYSLPQVDVIKIDAEGYELKIIEGSRKVLREFKPAIQVELLDFAQFDSFRNFISNFGYMNCTALDGDFPNPKILSSSAKVATNFQFLYVS